MVLADRFVANSSCFLIWPEICPLRPSSWTPFDTFLALDSSRACTPFSAHVCGAASSAARAHANNPAVHHSQNHTDCGGAGGWGRERESESKKKV